MDIGISIPAISSFEMSALPTYEYLYLFCAVQVVPFGPFLPDDFDMSRVEDFARLLSLQKFEMIVVFTKLFLAFILLPLVLLVITFRTFVIKVATV